MHRAAPVHNNIVGKQSRQLDSFRAPLLPGSSTKEAAPVGWKWDTKESATNSHCVEL